MVEETLIGFCYFSFLFRSFFSLSFFSTLLFPFLFFFELQLYSSFYRVPLLGSSKEFLVVMYVTIRIGLSCSLRFIG